MEIQNKFQNGKIYKITDIGYNKCYIGSTTEELSMRMARHRSKFKVFLKSGEGYISSCDLFNEYGVENCKIELIQYYKCDTLQELRKREGEHIKNTECVNKLVAGRTQKEYNEDNKVKLQEKAKEYHEANKDKINEHKREYYKINKDKIHEHKKEYREQNRDKINEKAKEYREQNKDKIKDLKKQWYENNKEKIKDKSREAYKLKKEINKS